MSLTPKVICLAILIAAPVTSQGRVEGRGAARRFISQKYGFSIGVPGEWGVSTTLDTPVFLYAPDSERFVQATIPKGGAVIAVEPHDAVSGLAKSATTPEQWAQTDAHAFASTSPSLNTLQMPRESGVSNVVMSSYDEEVDQEKQHSVAIFWEFDHKLFAAHLNYNANDSHGPDFERTLLQTIRSIRPLGKANK